MADFASAELAQALSEVGWGLKSWETLTAIPYEARAKLELLEDGAWAIVNVSERGWEVLERNTAETERKDDERKSFETLDDLLSHISPAFENRRIKLLTEKLETISARRSWGEDDEYTEAEV